MTTERTPIIVGVGDSCQRLNDTLLQDLTKALSAIDLAAEASQKALDDAGISSEQIDTIALVRDFDDSLPMQPTPFGRSNNPPGSLAKRIGATPATKVHGRGGGDMPQRLVNEWSECLYRGEAEVVLLTGAEAIATAKAAQKTKQTLDWSEDIGGDFIDQGCGIEGMFGVDEIKHGFVSPITQYAATENIRRSQLGRSVSEHMMAMGELFEPFTHVAVANPYSMFPVSHSAQEIATPSESNPWIDFPYTKHMVAKDGVNQGAALILTTVGKANALGIDNSKWVYLHGYAHSSDIPLLKRAKLNESVALKKTYQLALANAQISVDDISVFDLYSCFPIVVELAKDALGIGESKHALTQTGGLPFFGGPGSNYSMHGISATVRTLRDQPDAYGIVGANGGMIQKHAVGVYSCKAGWQRQDVSGLQEKIDAQEHVTLEAYPSGEGIIESYTVSFKRNKPVFAVAIGRLDNGKRFIANPLPSNPATVQRLLEQDCMGERIYVTSTGKSNSFAFDKSELPVKAAAAFKDEYKFCKVVINAHILEITINRPEVHNSLHPKANEELASVFDAYMADPNLRVAIITGAGEQAFCTGNDLKYSASGKPVWMPITGFAGLTARVGRNKPVIAAVNGFAMGGGMEIALASDIVVAVEHAQFALPEVKVGLIAAAGGVIRLRRQIPEKLAMEMILTGGAISAHKAQDYGLINHLVTANKLMETARNIAEEIAANSPTSIKLSMDLIAETANQGDANKAAGPSQVIDRLITSEDFYEGPKAFAQKRKPVWVNK